MIADFLKRLIQPEPAPIAGGDARLALTGLLVRVAKTDGDFAASERAQILRVLDTRYGLTGDAAQTMLGDAETLEAQAPDTITFTRAIKEAVAYDDRLGVIEALWSVVLADGVREDEEDALLRLVASLLGVNDRDSAMARQRVAKQ